jgi:hypothetical protein
MNFVALAGSLQHSELVTRNSSYLTLSGVALCHAGLLQSFLSSHKVSMSLGIDVQHFWFVQCSDENLMPSPARRETC